MRCCLVFVCLTSFAACVASAPESVVSLTRGCSSAWVEEARLRPEGLDVGSSFGAVIDISGDRLIAVTLPEGDAGRIFTYYREDGQWLEDEELEPTPEISDPEVKFHVAISGDRAVVGAYNYWGREEGYGAWVFVREPEGWKQEVELVPPESFEGSLYGIRVAISGNTAVVAAPPPYEEAGGRVHVFVRGATGWEHQAALDRELPQGWMLALEGNTLLCGGAEDQMYVYHRTGTDWAGEELETPPAARVFGRSRAIAGDMIVIGDPQAEELVPPSEVKESDGAAYVYRLEGEHWALNETIFPEDKIGAKPYSNFGSALAATAEVAVIAAQPTVAWELGGLFYYRIQDGQWTFVERLNVEGQVLDVTMSYDTLAFGATSPDGEEVIVLRAAELSPAPPADDGGAQADTDAAVTDGAATEDTSSSSGCDCATSSNASVPALPLLVLLCLIVLRNLSEHRRWMVRAALHARAAALRALRADLRI